MSTGLSRLIAQAQGAETGGVRPRPKTRFEDGGLSSEGLQETPSERVAPNAQTPASDTMPQRMEIPRNENTPDVEDGPVPRVLSLIPEAPAEDQRRPAPPLLSDEDARTAANPEAVNHEPMDRGETAFSAPSFPPSQADDPRDSLPETLLSEEAAATPEMQPTPEPLLPLDPPAPVLGQGTPEPALPPLHPNPAPQTQPPVSEDTTPEIVIEIGRIDLKPAPAAPAASPPSVAPARQLPSLGDYLRGKSG